MTDREKAIVMAYTGVCMLSGDKFSIFHEYVESIMGRHVYTHEMAIKAVDDEIKEKAKADFIALCAEQEPCEDVISRKTALECLEWEYPDKLPKTKIMELPPVQPKQRTGHWIPVSERLPENHKDVLICLSSDEICIGCYNSHKLPFSNNAIGWGASYTHDWCSDDVIAWMPLPEPYKEMQ